MASMSSCSLYLGWLFLAFLLPAGVTGFISSTVARCNMRMGDRTYMRSQRCSTGTTSLKPGLNLLAGLVGGAAALALPLAAIADPPLEKFGKQMCVQRNLNGSCSKFAAGDERDSGDEVPEVAKKSVFSEEPESQLVKELKRRSVENKSRNDEETAAKTFANGQAGEFGPFSRYVPVKHKDTGTYELLDVSQLEDMKKAGLVMKERGVLVFADST